MHLFLGKNNEDILKAVNQVLDDYNSPAKVSETQIELTNYVSMMLANFNFMNEKSVN